MSLSYINRIPVKAHEDKKASMLVSAREQNNKQQQQTTTTMTENFLLGSWRLRSRLAFDAAIEVKTVHPSTRNQSR